MTKDHFNSQVERLKSQWPHGYGHERVARMWICWKSALNEHFTEIIDHCIDTMRVAPLNEDLAKIELVLKAKRANQREVFDLSKVSMWNQMQAAAQVNETADKDFVQTCLMLLRAKLMGKMTMEQFLIGCDELDTIAKNKRLLLTR